MNRPSNTDRSARERTSDSVEVVGCSPRLLACVDLAKQAARTNLSILIVGETGTGKELLAQLIHRESQRGGALVDVDCGALPEDLMEALLFGHRRGAFTNAFEHSDGLIAEADQGTLFLDELGSLSMKGQAKLLRVLETGTVRRVGEARPRFVEFRFVGTAQPVLWEMIREKRFRTDLLQRLSGVVLELPRLADRGTDVLLLASHFAESAGFELNDDAEPTLLGHDWPGNIRELKLTMERAALFATGGIIGERELEAALRSGPTQHDSPQPEHTTWQDAHLRALCRRFSGDVDSIASTLGVHRTTLYRRLHRAGIDLDHFRTPFPV